MYKFNANCFLFLHSLKNNTIQKSYKNDPIFAIITNNYLTILLTFRGIYFHYSDFSLLTVSFFSLFAVVDDECLHLLKSIEPSYWNKHFLFLY